jgi:hypothetical protein
MDLKTLLTIKPAGFDLEKTKKAFLAKENLVLLDFSGSSYGLHMRILDSIRKLSDRLNHPIGVVHLVHPDSHELHLDVASRLGVHALAVPSLDLSKLAKIKKRADDLGLPVFVKANAIHKDEALEKLIHGFIVQSKYLQLFDFKAEKKKGALAKHLLDFAQHAGAAAMAVGDWELARTVMQLKPRIKIAFVSSDKNALGKACLIHGIFPVALNGTVINSMLGKGVVAKGQRIINASNLSKGVTIELVL